jgi:hypothetical protein
MDKGCFPVTAPLQQMTNDKHDRRGSKLEEVQNNKRLRESAQDMPVPCRPGVMA